MECLIDTYFEPLAHSDEQDVVALVTEITNLQVHERELLEANCIEAEQYLLENVLPYVASALRRANGATPVDPMAYIQYYLLEIGKQIEKSNSDKTKAAYVKELFEANQIEKTKILREALMSQFHERFQGAEKSDEFV